MSNSQQRALEKYIELMNTNAIAQIIASATDLGVFSVLGTGQKTLDQLATACKGQPEPLQILLDALKEIGVVEQYGEDYALAAVMGMVGQHNADLGTRNWLDLTTFVREGTGSAERNRDENDSEYRASSLASQWTMTPAALSAVKALEIGETRQGLNILDLGGGSSVWSLSILHSDSTSRLTVVDWSSALQHTIETANSIGVQDRVSVVAGDYQRVELDPEKFDLVILANVLQLQEQDEIAASLGKIFSWLKPAGELAVIDVFAGQDEGALSHVVHALDLAMRTHKGRVCDPTSLQQAIVTAGFEKPTYAHLPVVPHVYGLMVAKKK